MIKPRALPLLPVGCAFVGIFIYALLGVVFARVFLGSEYDLRWREYFADPILELNVSALTASRNQPAIGLAIAAAAYFVLLTVFLSLPQSVSQRIAVHGRRLTPQTAELEAVQKRLRALLSTDVEQLALQDARNQVGGLARKQPRSMAAFGGGCLLMLLWFLFTAPFLVAISLAQFIAIRDIYSKGALLEGVAVPASLVQFADIPLSDSSILLSALLLLLSLLRWLVVNSPVTTFALPSGVPLGAYVSALVAGVLIYFALDAATLYFLCIVSALVLLRTTAVSFVVRPIWARVLGRVTKRRVAGIP